MKQQINLYQHQPRRREPLCALHVAAAVAVLGVALLCSTLYLSWDSQNREDDLRMLQARQAELQRQVTELDKQLPQPQIDPALERELAALERELVGKRGFLRRFGSEERAPSQGFAGGLVALARQPVKNLWLREIHFYGDGRLAFRGGMTDPEALPAFVSALGRESVFQGRHFRRLHVERDGDTGRQLEFRLQSSGIETE